MFNKNDTFEVHQNGKRYVFIPLCTFHGDPDNSVQSASDTESRYGLKDAYNTHNMYEITDEKKWFLAKIKLGL